MPNTFSLKILGSSSAIQAKGRAQSAQVLSFRNNNFLIDCGENTQSLLSKYSISHSKIKVIFISHLHGDHYLGLFGLISTLALLGRKTPLKIFGPIGLKEIITTQAKYSGTTFPYELSVTEIDKDFEGDLYEDTNLTVQTFKLIHRVPTHGFLFKEKQQDRNIKIDLIPPYAKPEHFKKLKQGKDVHLENGELLKASEVTSPPPKQRSYAYCSDTAYNELLPPIIKGSTLLYHESTFLHELKERAETTMHSTSKQAAQIAKMANVDKLIVGHFSARYDDLTPFKKEAQEIFTNTELAIEGSTFTL